MPDGVRATFWRVLASDKSSSRFSKAIHALLTNDRQTEFTVSLSQATEGEKGASLSGAYSAACLLPVQHVRHGESTTLPIRRRTR